MITVIVANDVEKRNNVLKYLQDTKWESNGVQVWDYDDSNNEKHSLATQWFFKRDLDDNRFRYVILHAKHFDLDLHIFTAVSSICLIPEALLKDIDQLIILDKCGPQSEHIIRREYATNYWLQTFPKTPFMIDVTKKFAPLYLSLPTFPTRVEYYQGILKLLCEVLMPVIAESVVMSFIELPPPPS